MRGVDTKINTKSIFDKLGLPASHLKAKPSSSNYASFVKRFGTDVYELEAVPPEDLQRLLRNEIESALDWDAFQHEQDQQEKDIDRIAQARAAVRKALAAIGLEGGEA